MTQLISLNDKSSNEEIVHSADLTVGKATQLETSRSITLTGAASGSSSFNGSANITISTTLPMLPRAVLGCSSDFSGGIASSIEAASDHQVLRRSGASIGFGAINLAQANATTGALPVGRGGTGQISFSDGMLYSKDGNLQSTGTPTAGHFLTYSVFGDPQFRALNYGDISGTPDIAVQNINTTEGVGVLGSTIFGGSASNIKTTANNQVLLGGLSSVTFGKVTNSHLSTHAALSVMGRAANSVGDISDIAAGSDHQVLRRSGNTLAFGAINLAQANATTGALPVNRGGTGLTSITSGSFMTGNGTSAVALRTAAQVWGDIGPTARTTTGTWTAAQTFTGGLHGVNSMATGAFAINLTGNPQNVTLNLNEQLMYDFVAGNAGTTNLTFTTGTGSRIICIGYVGGAAGRIVNWPSGVLVFSPGGGSEASFTIPAGVRGVVMLIQMSSTIFYRVT